jgi:hypothetical protein
MRTFLWCAVTAAVAVGGTYWATDYGHRNPQSCLGHCVAQSARGCGEDEYQVPQEPIPIAEETPVETSNTLNAVVQLPPPEVLPAPVVIPEEGDGKDAEEIPWPLGHKPTNEPLGVSTTFPFATGDATCIPAAAPSQSQFAEVQPAALFMPYCSDDPPRMPYADEECDKGCCEEMTEDEAKAATDTFLRSWFSLFSKGEKDVAEESEPAAKGDCKEDPHRHEMFPGLPFSSGVRSPVRPNAAPTFVPVLPEPTPRKGKPSDELFNKGSSKAEPGHGRPCVDTMEFRPTDARANEFRLGPL